MPAKHTRIRSGRWWIGLAMVAALLTGGATVALLDRTTTKAASALPSGGGESGPAPAPSATPAATPTTAAPSPSGSSASPRRSATPTPTKPVAPTHTTARPTPTATKTKTQTTVKFYVTLYGAHDNTPANSTAIAYPVIHQRAGGTGTYADPISFATDKSELAIGTRIYYPYLKRYFIMEDDCTECDEDWTGHGPDGGPQFRHIDLWAGDSDDPDIENCEGDLTQDGQVAVIVKPASNLPVSTVPLYANGKCYHP